MSDKRIGHQLYQGFGGEHEAHFDVFIGQLRVTSGLDLDLIHVLHRPVDRDVRTLSPLVAVPLVVGAEDPLVMRLIVIVQAGGQEGRPVIGLVHILKRVLQFP